MEGMCVDDLTINEIVLHVNQKCFAKETSIYASPNSWKSETIGVGKGFVSKIYRITFDWSTHSQLLPKSVVLKIPTDENLKDVGPPLSMFLTTTSLIENLHCHECSLYTYKGFPKDTCIPRCYGMQNNPDNRYIILEDFSDQCSQVTEREGLNKEQAMQVCDAIAKIHAYTVDHPEALKQICVGDEGTFSQFFNSFSKATLCTLEMLIELDIPGLSKSKLERLKRFCTPDVLVNMFTENHKTTKLLVGDRMETVQLLCMPSVLVHCDLWHSNLLFNSDEYATNSTKTGNVLLAIIDWQAHKIGNGLIDLARLTVFNLNSELRKELTPILLQRYHQTLTSACQQTITLEQIEEAYKIAFPFTAIYYLLPLLLNIQMQTGEGVIVEMKSKAVCLIDELLANFD